MAGSIGSASVPLTDAAEDAGGSRMLSFAKVEEESVANVRASQTLSIIKVQEAIQARKEAYEGAAENLRKPKIQEALKARKDDADRLLCEVCGERPRERRRRRDKTWYQYTACRRCRRLPASAKPEPVSITDTRLLCLLQELYGRLWALKEKGFPGAPKKLVLDRLKILAAVVKE